MLALRVSVGLALLAEVFAPLRPVSVWLQAAAIFASVLLSLGWLTPLAAVVGLAIHVVAWAQLGWPAVTALVVIVLDALALCLLGPGAYSIDSYRFGRRVLVVPPR